MTRGVSTNLEDELAVFTEEYSRFVIDDLAEELPPRLGRLPRIFDLSSVLLYLRDAFSQAMLTQTFTSQYRAWMNTQVRKAYPRCRNRYPITRFVGVGPPGRIIAQQLLGSMRREEPILEETAHYTFTIFPKENKIELPSTRDRGPLEIPMNRDVLRGYLEHPELNLWVYVDDTDREDETGETQKVVEFMRPITTYIDPHKKPQTAPYFRIAPLSLGPGNGDILYENQVSLTTRYNMARLHAWVFRKMKKRRRGHEPMLLLSLWGGGAAWANNMKETLPKVLKKPKDPEAIEYKVVWLELSDGKLYHTDWRGPLYDRPFTQSDLEGYSVCCLFDDLVGSGLTMSYARRNLGPDVMYAALATMNPEGLPWVKSPLILPLSRSSRRKR